MHAHTLTHACTHVHARTHARTYTHARTLIHVLNQIQADKRKYVAKLREANKRVKRAKRTLKKSRAENDKLYEENEVTKKRLAVATAQLAAFRVEHPDWRPPDSVPLISNDATELTAMFRVRSYYIQCFMFSFLFIPLTHTGSRSANGRTETDATRPVGCPCCFLGRTKTDA